jgi:hypothetical protein
VAAKYTQDDIDRVRKALTTGALQVKVADRMTVFRSQDEMLELITIMENDVAGNKRIKRFRFATSKGL